MKKYKQDPSIMVDYRELSRQAYKSNRNLNLDDYNPLVREFKNLSQNLFTSDNIFQDKKKMLEVNKQLRTKTVRAGQ